MNAFGTDFVDPATKKAQFDTDKGQRRSERHEVPAALHGPAGHHLRPAQGPAADVQRHGGDGDHVLRPDERPDARDQQQVRRASSPSPHRPPRPPAAPLFSRLSIDGWSIPVNTQLDENLLFELIGSSVSEDASKASVPAAFPARQGVVTKDSSPYAQAATGLDRQRRSRRSRRPYTPDVSNAVISLIAQTVLGKLSVDEGIAADAGRRREGAGRVLIARRVGGDRRTGAARTAFDQPITARVRRVRCVDASSRCWSAPA